MNKFTHLSRFVGSLFDDPETIRIATEIIKGMIQSHSPRLSDISREMRGNEAGNYKKIQRFLERTEPQEALLRLFQSEAEFVLVIPQKYPDHMPEKRNMLAY
jgi:hypothetical protein